MKGARHHRHLSGSSSSPCIRRHIRSPLHAPVVGARHQRRPPKVNHPPPPLRDAGHIETREYYFRAWLQARLLAAIKCRRRDFMRHTEPRHRDERAHRAAAAGASAHRRRTTSPISPTTVPCLGRGPPVGLSNGLILQKDLRRAPRRPEGKEDRTSPANSLPTSWNLQLNPEAIRQDFTASALTPELIIEEASRHQLFTLFPRLRLLRRADARRGP